MADSTGDPAPEPRPLREQLDRALLRQLGPFVGTTLVAWVAVLFGTRVNWAEYALSVAMLFASWAYGLVTGLRGRMLAGTALGSLGYLLALGLMRDAAGGSVTAIGIVALLPMIQTALYVRERSGLWIVLAGTAAFYLGPLILIGAPRYPANGYRGALLGVLVSSIVGLAVRGLVADVRRRASEARRRERILVRVNETVQQLYRSANPRHDACNAVHELSDALVVGLYEPDPVSGMLLLSTTTGARDGIAAGVAARWGSAVHDAFSSRSQRLICDDAESHVGNVEMWRSDGAPSSLLYQPLLTGDKAVGVMFIGWSERVEATGPRVVVASLLAHEVAAVIDRADEIEQLTGEALSDALTGLPNRRAWNMRIAALMAGGADPVATVMFDIDHFKHFNDTHGHAGGDRLLRETAAAWRAELRSTDFLARLGGEEFALLLTGHDTDSAQALVARLRSAMPMRQTVSAGIALRRAGETPEQLLGRADRALYRAKHAGRDRAMLADEPPGPAEPAPAGLA